MNKIPIICLILLLCGSAWGGVDFDDDDDWLTCGTSDTLIPDGSAFTFSAWIYPRSSGAGNYGRVLSRGLSASSAEARISYLATNAIQWTASNSGTNLDIESNDNSITFNTWQHLIITTDGSLTATNTHIYINNAEVGYKKQQNGTVGFTDNSGDATRLGNRNNGGVGDRAPDTIISEAAIWNEVLSATERALLASSRLKRLPLQISAANLMAYWALDDEPEGTSADGDTF